MAGVETGLFTMGDHQLIFAGMSVTTRALSVPPPTPCCLRSGPASAAWGRSITRPAGSTKPSRPFRPGSMPPARIWPIVRLETIAGLHATLGDSYLQRGHQHPGVGELHAAAGPHLEVCWCNFGDVHLRTGRAHDAIPLFRLALKLNPAHLARAASLPRLPMATRQYLAARRCCSNCSRNGRKRARRAISLARSASN